MWDGDIRPTTRDALEKLVIPGMGNNKKMEYGGYITQLLLQVGEHARGGGTSHSSYCR